MPGFKKSIFSSAFFSSIFILSACNTPTYTPPAAPLVFPGAVPQTTVTSGSSAAAPSDLSVSAVSSSGLRLRWVDHATDETSFLVYRGFSLNGAYTLVATLPANTQRWTDSGLFPSTTYYYQVKAAKGTDITAASSGNATTYAGDWKEISSSATNRGLSSSVPASLRSSNPVVATDSNGVTFIAWQQSTPSGTDQIYGMLYDPSRLDSNQIPIGWKPLIVNSTWTSTTQNSTTNIITAVTYTNEETSISGKGLSQAVGNAMNPALVYNAAQDEFILAWQENRSGYYQVVARRIKIYGYKTTGLGNFYAQMTDSAITANFTNVINSSVNPFEDDSFTTTASTWVLSEAATPANQQLNVALASVNSLIYGVWQQFTGNIWQIYGTKTTLAAAAAYADADTNPAIASPLAAAIVPIDDTGLISESGTGISQTVVANQHSTYPAIAVAQDSVAANGNNNVYITWQKMNTISGYWEIKAIGCVALCAGGTGTFDPIIDVVDMTGYIGDLQHPKIATTIDGYPIIVFDGNPMLNTATSTNYEVYAVKGDDHTATLPTSFATITDTVVSSGDISTGGLSASSGSSQFPTLTVYNQDIFVAWQDIDSDSIVNIFLKKYEASVPTQAAAWKGVSASDESSGVSASTVAAVHPYLYTTSGGSVILTWQQFVGVYSIYLKQY